MIFKMEWCYYFLVKKPFIFILIITAISCACITISLIINLPDFSDPTLGFETRGTSIGNRLITWQNLLQETGPTKILVSNPRDLYINKASSIIRTQKIYTKHKRKGKLYKGRLKIKENNSELKHGMLPNKESSTSESTTLNWKIEHNANENKGQPFASFNRSNSNISMEEYFCNSPNKAYSHFVVKHREPKEMESFLDLNSLLALCQLQEQITKVANYKEYCQRDLVSTNCCRPWSLANYAAFLTNKSSCFDLTQNNLMILRNVLLDCFDYYRDFKLSNNGCNEMEKCDVPEECTKDNVVYNIFQYLVDDGIRKANDYKKFLQYSMIFIPVVRSAQILSLYHEWEKLDSSNDHVGIIGMDLGLENELFSELLLRDSWLVALGGVFIMVCMWLYTSSIFFTIMTCVAVTFSLGLAYFIYTVALQMSFFPYMNLLAVIVTIGIGADDAFIFIKIWQCVLYEKVCLKSNTNEEFIQDKNLHSTITTQNLITLTIRHASLSMFVTSATTAAAFYASYTSKITAIKCFSIFAATAVITNYVLMIIWLPASISLMECTKIGNACNILRKRKILDTFNSYVTLLNSFCSMIENCIIYAVINYAFVFIIIFGIIGSIGMLVVLYKPGLQLSESSHIQLFTSSHPFEMYNSVLKQRFGFEKSFLDEQVFKFPLRFVWGLKQIDDGDYTNPHACGNLHFDNYFAVHTKSAQTWLLKFCENLKQQPFYELSSGIYLPDCFMENFVTLMDRMCFSNMDDVDYTPCCNISSFPYEKDVFDVCLPEIISLLYTTPRKYFIPSAAGPRFIKAPGNINNFSTSDVLNISMTNSSPEVKVIVIEFESNFSYTTAYHEVKGFIQSVEQWFYNELATAPFELQRGWFVSDLTFFDLQKSLYNGTLIAIAVAMGISLAILFLVTCNVLVALYAVITILFAIFVTIGTLVLFGWKLNILESITISAAIGLTIDFSLHYGIHYRLSPTSDRSEATRFALSRIIGPTAMAAFTSGVPGAFMLFSNVLPYIQIGTFLLVMMIVSWMYATFFLMSLLKLFGSQFTIMRFPYIQNRTHDFYEVKCEGNHLLSTSHSVVTDLTNGDPHETESPTSVNIIKTVVDVSHANV